MNIKFIAADIYKECIYFSANYFNGLMKYNFVTKEFDFIRPFEKEGVKTQLYSRAITHGHTIWFLPWEAKRIAKYNIANNELDYYEIPFKNGAPCLEAFLLNHILYFVTGGENRCLLTLDLENSSINTLPCHFYPSAIYAGDDRIYAVDRKGDIHDLIETKVDYFDSLGYISSLEVEGYIWLIPFESDKIERICVRENIKEVICTGIKEKYCHGIALETDILFFPAADNSRILKIDRQTNEISYVDSGELKKTCHDWTEIKPLYKREKDFMAVNKNGYLYTFDLAGNLIETVYCKMDNTFLGQKISASYKKYNIQPFKKNECIIKECQFGSNLKGYMNSLCGAQL